MSTLFLNFANVIAGNPRCHQAWDFTNAEDITEFTATAISSGTAAYQAVSGGVLRLSGAATTDNSGHQIQLENPPVRLVANGVATVSARLQTSVIAVEWIMGLAILDASLVASVPDDGIYLHKQEVTGEVRLIVRSGGVERLNRSLGVIAVAATYQTWTIQVRSEPDATKARLQVYLDGVMLFDDPVLQANMPNTAALTPSYAMQSGSATGTQSADLDYLFLSASRV